MIHRIVVMARHVPGLGWPHTDRSGVRRLGAHPGLVAGSRRPLAPHVLDPVDQIRFPDLRRRPKTALTSYQD